MSNTISASKTVSINARVNGEAKRQAEDVLAQLGVSMSTAIDMFIRQIAREQRLPINLSIRKSSVKPPRSIDPSQMTPEEFSADFQRGLEEAMRGEGTEIHEWYAEFKKENPELAEAGKTSS